SAVALLNRIAKKARKARPIRPMSLSLNALQPPTAFRRARRRGMFQSLYGRQGARRAFNVGRWSEAVNGVTPRAAMADMPARNTPLPPRATNSRSKSMTGSQIPISLKPGLVENRRQLGAVDSFPLSRGGT